MFTLNTSSLTVEVFAKGNSIRSAVASQPAPQQPGIARRPSFLLVLLRALGSMAA